MQLSPKVGQECELPILSEALSRTGSHNLQDGKGKGSHQHRRHRPCRLWQVDHHWSLDLQGGSLIVFEGNFLCDDKSLLIT